MPARSSAMPAESTYVEAVRITTRPALVAACGGAALAALVGVALVLSVWKGLPVTASVIATGGLLTCAMRAWARGQPDVTASTQRRPSTPECSSAG